MQRIYVDFNTLMSEPVDLVKLSTDTSPNHLSWKDGEHVILFDEEMEVEATILYSKQYHYWLAEPDWTTRVDLLPAPHQHGTDLTV